MKRVTYPSFPRRANTLLATLVVSILFQSAAWGWSDHSSLVWPLLREQPQLVEQRVVAEPLADFVRAERVGIAKTLAQVEAWAVDTIEHYPPTPEGLLSQAENELLRRESALRLSDVEARSRGRSLHAARHKVARML